MLKIENLRVEIEGQEIIKGLDLEMNKGEIHAIMGPNGSGKSTLSNVLMGHPRYEVTGGDITFEGEDVTFAELDLRANRIAHRLLAMGVRKGDPVGICVERSVEMVAGLLGILKAGGAYLPIDPTYPKQRVAFMLGDARPPILLVQQHLVDPQRRARDAVGVRVRARAADRPQHPVHALVDAVPRAARLVDGPPHAPPLR